MNSVYLWMIWLNDFEATAHTWTAVQTFAAGLVATQSVANTRAILGTGNGTAEGIRGAGGTGGSGGIGVVGAGGTPNGVGVSGAGAGTGVGVKGIGGDSGSTSTSDGAGLFGLGGSTGGPGIWGEAANGTNSRGGTFLGKGTGHGVFSTGGASGGPGVAGIGGASNGVGVVGSGGAGGNSYGVYGIGGAAGGIGGAFIRGDADTAAVALEVAGSIDLEGSTNVAGTTAVKNKVTKGLICKARGYWIEGSGLQGEYVNIASVTNTGTYVEVTMAQGMADIYYNVNARWQDEASVGIGAMIVPRVISATVFQIYAYDAAGVIINPNVLNYYTFEVFGAQ